jgi:hypothetical protein
MSEKEVKDLVGNGCTLKATKNKKRKCEVAKMFWPEKLC